MISLTEMSSLDLYRLDNINLDQMTENYDFEFYYYYLSNWPDLCACFRTQDGVIAGYIIGKVENKRCIYGHISALSVDPEFRREGVARRLVEYFETCCFKNHSSKYVDLFVRVSNNVAISFYKSMLYKVHKRIPQYYSCGEDAFEMRKYP